MKFSVNKLITQRVFFQVLLLFFFLNGVKAQITTQVFNYSGALQTFTVPGCVSIMTIDVRGAQGGNDGGKGALMIGVFTVTPGQVFRILVGQAGGVGSPISGAGGGGGSFVTDLLNNPYVVAGGGGGTGQFGSNSNYTAIGGTTLQTGEAGQYTGGAGGSGGSGGGAAFIPQSNAAGGGGLTGSGSSGVGANGGSAYTLGGAGGSSTGGYGGGGGSNVFNTTCGLSPNGGSGGGGYSGGGGGGSSGVGNCNGAGGGGGSFNSGSNQFNVPAVHAGNGRVTFSYGSTIMLTASPQFVCAGSSTTLNISGPLSNTWVANGSTSNSMVVSPTITTTYQAYIIPPQGCTALVAAITVTVFTPPTVTATTAGTVCPLAPVNLSAGGAVTYTWQPGNLLGTPAIANPSAQTVYTVTGTDALGCTNTATLMQYVFPTPTVTASSPTVCQGSNFAMTAGGAMSYTWQPGNLPGAVTGVANTSTTYTVTGTSALGCTASATGSLVVFNPPAPPLTFTVNSISCASLGSATVSASGAGPYTYTWLPSGQIGPMATGLAPGTCSITIFNVAQSCISNATVSFSSAQPFTGTLNNTASLTCNGVNNGTANVTNITGGSPNPSFFWTDGAVFSSLPNPATLSAGNWSVTVTDALTGCSFSNTFVITQPPALTLNLASGSATTCASTSVALTSTLSGGVQPYQFNWIGGPTTASYAAVPAFGGSYVYTLNATDFNGCPISDTIGITVTNNPTLSVSNVSICPGSTGQLTVSGSAGSTYLWNTGTIGAVLSDNPLSTTPYIVVASAFGCSTAATASMVVLPVMASPGSNSPLCDNDALQLTANSGAVSYSWTGPSSFTASVQNPGINPISMARAGVYSLTLTAVNGCTAAASTMVIVNPVPPLTALGSTVCTGQANTTLSASSFTSASYLWQGPLSFTSNAQSPTLTNPVPNASGNYTVTVTSVAGCTNMAVVQQLIVDPPVLTLTLSGTNFCAQAFNGSPNIITLSASGALNYGIAAPGSVFNYNPSGPSTYFSPLPPYNNAGVITITVSGSNNVCTVVKFVPLTIIANPTISATVPATVICAGQSFTHTMQGASAYTWGPATASLVTYNMGSMAVASPTSSSVYTVFGSSFGCSSPTQSVTVMVNALPTVSLTVDTAKICSGSSISLTAGGSATGYSWSPGTGLSAATGSMVTASLFASQQYTVIGTANNCSNSAVVYVKVLGLPSANINASRSSACIYDTVVFKGSGGKQYHWTGPYDFNMYGKNTSFVIGNLAQSGNYTLTVTDDNGCTGKAVVPITVYEIPQIRLQGAMAGCAPFCPDIKFERAFPGSSLIITSWQTGVQTQTTGVNFTTCLQQPGNHIVTCGFKDSFTGCANTQSFAVSVLAPPQANFIWEPLQPKEDEDVHFINASKGMGQQRWSWYFVNNSGPVSSHENPDLYFENTGVYAVALVVSDINQCADTIVKPITVAPDFGIYIPNTFTPNNDGMNDTFKPVTRGRGYYSMHIFDRWGAMIYHTSDINSGWDGSFLNQPCKNEEYVYLITMQTADGQKKEYKGMVTLIR